MRPDPAFSTDDRPSIKDSADALPEALLAVLAERYAPMRQPASVDLHVADRPEASRRFTFGDEIACSCLDASAQLPAVRITTTSAVLEHMLAHPMTFDHRSAEIAALGGIRIDGAQRVAAYWFQLLKRPTPEASAALLRAGARDHIGLHDVPALDARAARDWPRQVIASILEGKPLLVQAAIDWPEVNWTLRDWCERDGTVGLRGDPRTGRMQMLKDIVDASDEAGTPHFMGANYTGGSAVPSAWESRFRLPGFAGGLFGGAQLWFGNLSSETLVTNLHCDPQNSFLAQVHGTKHVRLFPPREEGNVYALDVFNTYRPCRVDADVPDLNRFPRFTQARYVDVTIQAGDLLVIPTGWFHCVWAHGVTMSISRFATDTSVEHYARLGQHVASASLEGAA